MRRSRRLLLMVICSVLVGLVLPMDAKKKESLHGCGVQYYSSLANYYKEKPNSLDVIVAGDSNVYRAFSPMTFWKDENVASYVIATASQPAWISYYMVEDALRYQKPKVLVFEINELFAAAKGKTSRFCNAINALSPSTARLHAIADPSGGFDDDDRSVLYYAYTQEIMKNTLHGLDPLKKRDTKTDNTPNYKGYMMNTSTVPFPTYSTYMSRYDVNLGLDKDNASYVEKIIDLCKKKNIPLLFVKFPTKEWTSQKAKIAKKFAQQHHVPLLDMNVDTIGIDWMKDTKDAGFHLNDRGAQKATKAVENYISSYVDLTPTKDPAVIKSYNASLQRYEKDQKKDFATDKQ